jgi:uncharacterized membrane protein YeiH
MNAPLAETAIVEAIEIVAVLAYAFSAFGEAQRKQMDPVGVFTIACVTAFGGGTLRDLLLDRRPFFWVDSHEYVLLILVLTLLFNPVMRFAQRWMTEPVLVTADAIGLGFFSVTGTALALALGQPAIVAVLMGVMTGVCGGLLRDIILNEVPMVLRDGRPYALAAAIGCAFYLLLVKAGADPNIASWVSAALIVAVRLAAWRGGWSIK